MISIEEFREITADLLDELPQEFFRELSGGVIVSERLVAPDYAVGNDLYTMGQYQVYSGGRQITIFKGSFDRAYPQADAEETGRSCAVCCATNSGTIWNSWAAFTILPRWRRRTKGNARLT